MPSSIITDAVLDPLFELAQLEIAQDVSVPELWKTCNVTLVLNQWEYTMDSAWFDVSSRLALVIDGVNSYELDFFPWERFDRHFKYPDADSSGQPKVWTKLGRTLRIHPKPSSDYATLVWQMRGYHRPTAFASDSSTTDMVDTESIIIDLVVSKAIMNLEQYEMAGRFETRAKRKLDAYRSRVGDLSGEDVDMEHAESIGLGHRSSVAEPWLRETH